MISRDKLLRLIRVWPLSDRDHVFVIRDFKKPPISALGTAIFADIVGLYLPQDSIRLFYGWSGKPMLVPVNDRELHFSLSHSSDLLMVLFSLEKEVGIDVELIRHRKFMAQIASRYFSDEEQSLDLQGFYRSWTAREAFLKAIGWGIKNMAEIDVEPEGNGFSIGVGEAKSHQVRFFHPDARYLSAICRRRTTTKGLVIFECLVNGQLLGRSLLD